MKKKKKGKIRYYNGSSSLELIDLEKIVEEITWMSKRMCVCISEIEEEEYFLADGKNLRKGEVRDGCEELRE